MNWIICHSGVKGQKWGVRRYQNPDGTLTPAGKVHYKRWANWPRRMPKKPLEPKCFTVKALEIVGSS